MSQLLPNLYIAGAPKSGTSSLHNWLAAHPDALGSTPKETYYFVNPGSHMHDPAAHIENGLAGYEAFFPAPQNMPKLILESTPTYLYSQTALTHLPDLPSAPHFIFVLREPAAQIYSLYSYFKENWDWIPRDMDFATFVKIARRGDGDFKGNETARHALSFAHYQPYLEKWEARVGRARMDVFTFDALTANPKAFTQRVATARGLDPAFYETFDFAKENETYAVKAAWLQSLNIRLRALLPKGALYNWGRALYHRVNTQAPQGPDAATLDTLAQLREEFAPLNAALAARYSLDISSWQGAGK